MTPSEAMKWADTFGKPFDDKPDGSAIALATLATEVHRMRARIEYLRGALKSAAGRAYEVAEFRLGDDCMNWAGDMESPLMGSNVLADRRAACGTSSEQSERGRAAG